MNLAPHTKANREFFEARFGPRKEIWADWIERGLVKGKVVGDQVFVDLNWFAANDIMKSVQVSQSGIDLLL